MRNEPSILAMPSVFNTSLEQSWTSSYSRIQFQELT